MKQKVKKGEFLGMLLCIQGTRLLENMLAGKQVVRVDGGVIWAGEGAYRAGQIFKRSFIL